MFNFGETNIAHRTAYAFNFMVLFYSLVKSYIITHPEITGIELSLPKVISFMIFSIEAKKLLTIGIPSANFLSPIIQLFTGRDNMIKFLPIFFLIHILILWSEILSIFLFKSYYLWFLLCFIQQLTYSCIDLTLDQISIKAPYDGCSDQSFRSNGAVIGLMLPVFSLLLSPYIGMLICFILMTLFLTVILFYTAYISIKLQFIDKYEREKESNNSHNDGKIAIPQLLLIIIMILAMSIPDGVGDAISGKIAKEYKNSNLIVIKYTIMSLGWGLTHPLIHQTITRKIQIVGRWWPIFLMIFRVLILYFFPELRLLGVAEIGFFLQSILDTTGGTLIKNDIEQDNRVLFWSSKSTSKWTVPAVVANFIQEQAPPTLKKFLAVTIESWGSNFNQKVFIIWAAVLIGSMFILICFIQMILKNIEKKKND